MCSHRHLVALASFVVAFLGAGVSYGNAAVYYKYWLDLVGDSARTSAVGSCSMGFLCIAGPLASALTNAFGVRPVVMMGAVISTLGMVTASFSQSWELLLLSYGVITGVGWCISYVPGSVAAALYFPSKYHGLLFGLCISGNGFGMFVAPPLVEWLAEMWTWRGALLIQAGINLHILVCGAILFPLPNTKPKHQDIFDIQLLKNRTFLLFLFHILVFGLGISVFSVHFSFAVQRGAGLTPLDAALVVSVVGFTGTIGRIIQGIVAKLPGVNALLQYLVSFFCLGVGVLVVPHVRTYTVAMTLAGVIGFLQGPYGGVVPLLVIYMVGRTRITAGYGYFHLFVGVGIILGAPIAGALYDYGGGSYHWSMYFGGGTIILSVMMMCHVVCRWNSVIQHTKMVMEQETLAATTAPDVIPPDSDVIPLNSDVIKTNSDAIPLTSNFISTTSDVRTSDDLLQQDDNDVTID